MKEPAACDRLPRQAHPKRPRVWTVFLAVGLALFLAILFQACFGAVLAMIELSRGVKPAELGEVIVDRLMSPYVMISMMAMGQLAFAMAGILPALWSPEPFRERVGMRKARPSWRVYPLAMLGSIVPLAIGFVLAIAVANLLPVDESMLKFFDALTIDSWIVFVLFVGIAPGLIEEIIFRGYLQQRLVKRWGPTIGIVVASIVFGLCHITPQAVLVALPLGFWFGYIAWRSQSIFPAILCHFFVNSGLNTWRMIVKFGDLSESVQNWVHASSILIGVICFAICCWPGFWRERAESK